MIYTLNQIEAAGGFPIVYADCPWSYVQGGRGAAVNHYRTMTVEQIYALPITRLASQDALLFTWGTWPQLPVVLGSIDAWGFTFKTCAFLWVKHYEKSGRPFVGGGFWSRANSEFCLLATRGKNHPKRCDATNARSVSQLIENFEARGPDHLFAPPAGHSAKPAETRDRIVQMVGDLPRVELFARERAPGWCAWGDGVEPEIDMGV